MRGCHNCEHAATIAEGNFAGKAWEEIPCSTCNVMSGAGFAIEFDEEWPHGAGRPEPGGVPADEDEGGEERLPVAVMREIVVGLLKLKPELRDVVAWRFAGIRYDDIALAQGVTRACAEKRHKRAMELWPALRALFARKVAKQGMRRVTAQRAERDPENQSMASGDFPEVVGNHRKSSNDGSEA